MADRWICDSQLCIFDEGDDAKCWGVLENLETKWVGTEAEVMAALAEPKEHPEMVRKLALVGIEVGVKDDGGDTATGEGLERASLTRITRNRKGRS